MFIEQTLLKLLKYIGYLKCIIRDHIITKACLYQYTTATIHICHNCLILIKLLYYLQHSIIYPYNMTLKKEKQNYKIKRKIIIKKLRLSMHLYSNSPKLKQFRAVCPVKEELKTGVYKKIRWASRLCLTQQHSMRKLHCFVTESKNKSVQFRGKNIFFQHQRKKNMQN